MKRVIPITCALATALVAAAPVAMAQQDSAWWLPKQARTLPNGSNPVTAGDSTYIREALRGNFTEVALGRLAESNAENSDVKDFGKRMVEDHDAMNDQWSQLASSYKMRVLNPGVDYGDAGKEAIDRLEKLKGSQFDQAYMAEMIQGHEQALNTYQQMRTAAQDPQIRDLATSAASTVSQHLSLAREVGNRVGIASTAGRVGGVTYPTPSNPDNVRRPTSSERDNGNVANERNDRNNRSLRPLKAEDRRFVDGVLGDHLLHVRLARIAERNAERPITRELAQRIENEFTQWSKRWENFADRHNADVNSHLEKTDRNKIERLQDAKDKRFFDREYAQIVANHTKQMLDYFRKERWDERPDPAGRMAQKEIPLLQELHSQAVEVERKLAKGSDKK